MRRRFELLLTLVLVVLLGACGGGSSTREGGGSSSPSATNNSASTNKDDYPVFPDADAGADPAVPAEQGGKGFKGEGWQTNTTFDLIGDPRAVKGGAFRDSMISFPGTWRMAGPEWNNHYNYIINPLIYETLIGLHPATLEYMPALSTHWKIDPDKLTFRFRIDPNARFSDGTPVTSDDVVASYKFFTDKTLDDIYYQTQFGKLETPVAESKYIVRIKAKTLGWENFLIAGGGIRIFPAHVLKNVTGASYLKDYNFKLIPGTGPYVLNEADIVKGQSVTARRRKDYWAEKYRANIGMYNFDEYKLSVVRDESISYEMFKKGDLDYVYVYRPDQWAKETDSEGFKRGLLVKRAIFNNTPADKLYIGFNTRRKPWDDVRIRKAFALLFNRQQIIEKIYFNIFLPTNSSYPGTVYENPNNPKNLYNPKEALQLLADAGWKDRDAKGRLTKNGRPLEVELLYANKQHEKWLTLYQEDLRKIGISINLRFLTFETMFKMEMQREFELAVGAWGAGSIFPEPRPEYHSETADRNNTNNITGMKNKRVDEICEKYELEFDPAKRTELLKELDRILADEYHYIPRWYDPATRIVYLNKFGMPAGILSRVGTYDGSLAPGIPQLWWIDPDKAKKYEMALRDTSMKLDIPPVDDKYWQEKYGSTQKEMEAKTAK